MLSLRLRRKHTTQRMMSARKRRNPNTDPTTIPAIAPPESPRPPELAGAAVELAVGEDVGLVVEEKRSDIVEKTGRVTS